MTPEQKSDSTKSHQPEPPPQVEPSPEVEPAQLPGPGPQPDGANPAEWLLEAARRIPLLNYAIAVVGLVAAAALSIGFVWGYWMYALYGGLVVLFAMFLVRIYVAFTPQDVKINVSLPVQILIYAAVAGAGILGGMGLVAVGIHLFADTSGEKKSPPPPLYSGSLSDYLNARDTTGGPKSAGRMAFFRENAPRTVKWQGYVVRPATKGYFVSTEKSDQPKALVSWKAGEFERLIPTGRLISFEGIVKNDLDSGVLSVEECWSLKQEFPPP